jgi:hypothetical protein
VTAMDRRAFLARSAAVACARLALPRGFSYVTFGVAAPASIASSRRTRAGWRPAQVAGALDRAVAESAAVMA